MSVCPGHFSLIFGICSLGERVSLNFGSASIPGAFTTIAPVGNESNMAGSRAKRIHLPIFLDSLDPAAPEVGGNYHLQFRYMSQ